MAFDYKKEYKEFYLPPTTATIVNIPALNFLAFRGKGDPNAEDGEYKRSVEQLYAIAYTLKMSYKSDYKIAGYFDYVVPPLEGLWWQDDTPGVDYSSKDDFNFISLIRLLDFVKKEDFTWAIEMATEKKKSDFSQVEFLTYEEGLCVQCLHLGAYDDEPTTIALMEDYAQAQGYALDITATRYHHEIYLSDPRKCSGEQLKTVIRQPIKAKV